MEQVFNGEYTGKRRACKVSEADIKKKSQEEILEYLEYSYSGAKMLGDEETQLRLARAIIAFKADVYEDIFKDDIDLVSLT